MQAHKIFFAWMRAPGAVGNVPKLLKVARKLVTEVFPAHKMLRESVRQRGARGAPPDPSFGLWAVWVVFPSQKLRIAKLLYIHIVLLLLKIKGRYYPQALNL